MSKFSREDLKEVIKECVVEVLQESFGALQLVKEVQVKSSPRTRKNRQVRQSQHAINESQYSTNQSQKANIPQSRSSYLDNISYNQSDPEKSIQRNEEFDHKINNMTQQMTTDPVLADIFKDTARTTLQEQISAESRKGAMPINKNDHAAMKVSQSDPSDLFGAASGKWAELAFATNTKK